MLEIKNLYKSYEDKKVLEDFNLEIKDGEIFGLIGHNGAGKSTTIKSIVGIHDFESGNIFVDGINIKEDVLLAKKKMSYVADSPDLFLKLNMRYYLKFISEVYGIDKKESEENIEKYSKLFEMESNLDKTIGEFSHGMRQKVFIIGSLIVNPKLWILDEPMTGLDPASAFKLKNVMKERAKEGNSILFSTHVLEVAEQLCDRIAILNKGKILFLGSMEELKKLNIGEDLEKIYLNLVENHRE